MLKLLSPGLLLLALVSAPLGAAEAPATPAGTGVIPPPAGYGMGGHGPGMHRYGMAPPPFAGVQFTEAQRNTIDEMMTRERQAHQQRIERMQNAQARLQQLYQADIWDADAITAVYDEIFAEQRKTVEAMAKARNAVYRMLNEEQRAQMKQFELQMRRFGPPPQQ